MTWLYDLLVCKATKASHSSDDRSVRFIGSSSLDSKATHAFNPPAQRWRHAQGRVFRLLIALACTVVLINIVYGFEGTGKKLQDFEFLSASLGGEHDSRLETGNRYRGTWLGVLPVPVPREMVLGIDYVKWEFENGMPCYLLGSWKSSGWWHFYLIAMAVKFPIGTVVLIAIGAGGMLVSYLRKEPVGGEWLIPLVAVLFLAQVSSQTGFTHHLRYVLPSFGFLYLLATRSLLVLPNKWKFHIVGGCLAGVVAFHLTHIGMAHTHFNWLAGGPTQGWRHLGHSNVDWGQSTFRLSQWAREHPDLRPLTVLFAQGLGMRPQLLDDPDLQTKVQWTVMRAGDGETIPLPGWYLMSAEQLTHVQNGYFRKTLPHARPFADVALFYVPQDKVVDQLVDASIATE